MSRAGCQASVTLRRDIVEAVAAIGGARKQAAAGAAGHAVGARVAVDHVVVVVVVRLVGAQRGGGRELSR